MKKLRSFLTPVIVCALVGSAFAFSANKVASFCVSDNGDNMCDYIQINSHRVPILGTTYNIYKDWDGEQAHCVGTNNCTLTAKLEHN